MEQKFDPGNAATCDLPNRNLVCEIVGEESANTWIDETSGYREAVRCQQRNSVGGIKCGK